MDNFKKLRLDPIPKVMRKIKFLFSLINYNIKKNYIYYKYVLPNYKAE